MIAVIADAVIIIIIITYYTYIVLTHSSGVPNNEEIKLMSTLHTRVHCVLLFQVYAASNVELITRTRTDHLSDQNKNKTKGTPLYFANFTSVQYEH